MQLGPVHVNGAIDRRQWYGVDQVGSLHYQAGSILVATLEHQALGVTEG